MKVDLNGITIGYDDGGTGNPLVFIHAFPLSRQMWQPQRTMLEEHCRLITPDLRGFGESSVEVSATMEEMAADVVALLDHLELETAFIGGVSMGGYVALALMRQFPQRVRGLILADTRAGADSPEGRDNRSKLAEKATNLGAEAVAEQVIPGLLGAHTKQYQPAISEHVRALITANQPAGIAAASLGMGQRSDSRDHLESFHIPALVLVGTEDTLTPPSESEAMVTALPHAHLRYIEYAGHLSNLEQPEAFNRAIIDFLIMHRP